MQNIKVLLSKLIKNSSSYLRLFKPTNANLCMSRRLCNEISKQKMDNNEIVLEKNNDTNKSRKRSIKDRPLTEEQKKKRKEFFLKDEEWERNVQFNRLTDRGNHINLPNYSYIPTQSIIINK